MGAKGTQVDFVFCVAQFRDMGADRTALGLQKSLTALGSKKPIFANVKIFEIRI